MPNIFARHYAIIFNVFDDAECPVSAVPVFMPNIRRHHYLMPELDAAAMSAAPDFRL